MDNNITLIMISTLVVTCILIICVLIAIQNIKNKKIKKALEKLEFEKNTIDSMPINNELSKIETFLKNDKIDALYKEWKIRLENIKSTQIPHLTDLLIESDYSLQKLDAKAATYKLAQLEMEVYKVKTEANTLLDEIKEITGSEEKNRAIIITMKQKYREFYQRFNDNYDAFYDVTDTIKLQFTNIASQFENFEKVMENNDYTEVNKIIKSINEMLKHMEVVINETPSIILLIKKILPTKIKDVTDNYKKMKEMGYPLDYLNIEYNIDEANKKIKDCFERTKVLNLEDNLFELKVLNDYFDSVFNDFENERQGRKDYEETNQKFYSRLVRMNNAIKEIKLQIGDLKVSYNLSSDDIETLNNIAESLKNLNDDYQILINHTSNNVFAYSKLIKEIENLNYRLINLENNLDSTLDAIGNMREDETRAREQLEEIKVVMRKAKVKIHEHSLPVVPDRYQTELKEAADAVKEIVKELEQKPITIDVLNTRVDTARDLALKVLRRSEEISRCAYLAEMAIVYGNRYRPVSQEVNRQLNYSENLYYKGEYKKSLELTANMLEKIEPGIYNRLVKKYVQ